MGQKKHGLEAKWVEVYDPDTDSWFLLQGWQDHNEDPCGYEAYTVQDIREECGDF